VELTGTAAAGVVQTALGRLRARTPVAEGAAIVVLRPEQLRLGADGVAATVKAVEWLGPERHVVCAAGAELVTLREPAEGPDPVPGELVHLSCDPGDVHLFDPATTELLR
jgi:ABC-type sugar transport system ATPase subunit